ncbi:hypothetical protein SFRURICE_009629 [Spodoptera frugiperda]|nr:hypothetical protein SFRURICE_009629 [Spodoptera frugiperda]
MMEEQNLEWICHECRSKLPKVGNLNTPVRNLRECDTNAARSEEQATGLGNITFRKNKSDGNQKAKVSQLPITGSHRKIDDSLVSAISEQVHKVILLELPGIISNIMKTELLSIKEDLQDFRKSIDFISTGYDEMKITVDKLIKDNLVLYNENDALKSTVAGLSERLNTLEQHLREENVEIQGSLNIIRSQSCHAEMLYYLEDCLLVPEKNKRIPYCEKVDDALELLEIRYLRCGQHSLSRRI